MSNNWQKYKLGDIVKDIAMGPFGSNLKVDNFIDSGVPVIRGSNLNENGLKNNTFAFVSEEKANSLKRSLAYPDDLVFTHRGTLGQVAIIPHDGYQKYLVSQSQMRLSVNKDYLVPKFLYYFFKSPIGQSELLKNTSQVGVPAIANPTKSLKQVEISIPDLSTQEEIASILSALDDKIELNIQMSGVLEKVCSSVFKEGYIGIENDLPKGWVRKKLGEIVEVKGGTTPSTTVKEYWDGENYWSTPKDLSNLQFPVLLDTERKITMEGVKQISSGILPKGTLLLSSRAPVGYLAISQVPVSINQGYIAIQGKSVSNLFVLFWLKQNMEAVKSRANGSTFQEISKTSFKEIEIVVPEESILKQFDEIATPLFEKIVANEEQNRTLKQIRDSIIPKLMSGKIEIKA